MENEQLKKRIKFLTKLVNNEGIISRLLFFVPLGCSYFLLKLPIGVYYFTSDGLFLISGLVLILGIIAIVYFAPKYFQQKREELSKLIQYADNVQTEEQQFFAKNLQIVATFDKPISKQDHAKLCDFEQQYVLFCKQSDGSESSKFIKGLLILLEIFFGVLGCIGIIGWILFSMENRFLLTAIEWMLHGPGLFISLSLFLLFAIFSNFIMKKRKNKRSKIITQIEKELSCTVRPMTDSEKELYK